MLVKAHATHIQQMQVADIVEWFDFLQVRQGMDRADVIQNDIQDETHPVLDENRANVSEPDLCSWTIIQLCVYLFQNNTM